MTNTIAKIKKIYGYIGIAEAFKSCPEVFAIHCLVEIHVYTYAFNVSITKNMINEITSFRKRRRDLAKDIWPNHYKEDIRPNY